VRQQPQAFSEEIRLSLWKRGCFLHVKHVSQRRYSVHSTARGVPDIGQKVFLGDLTFRIPTYFGSGSSDAFFNLRFIPYTLTLPGWVKRDEVDSGEREVKELRRANDILNLPGCSLQSRATMGSLGNFLKCLPNLER
jgi:hypothetical protein